MVIKFWFWSTSVMKEDFFAEINELNKIYKKK